MSQKVDSTEIVGSLHTSYGNVRFCHRRFFFGNSITNSVSRCLEGKILRDGSDGRFEPSLDPSQE